MSFWSGVMVVILIIIFVMTFIQEPTLSIDYIKAYGVSSVKAINIGYKFTSSVVGGIVHAKDVREGNSSNETRT